MACADDIADCLHLSNSQLIIIADAIGATLGRAHQLGTSNSFTHQKCFGQVAQSPSSVFT